MRSTPGSGLYGLPGGNTGAQMGGWFRREVNTLSDLAGLKMRIAGLGGEIVSRLGVVPQQLSAGDIYPSLERGVIDAAEFVGPYDDERLGLEQVARNYYYPGWWEGGTLLFFFVNLEQWQALPQPYRSALTTAAAAANLKVQASFDARNPSALRRLVARGAVLRPFPREILDAGYAAANQVYAELSERSADFRAIYEHMVAFRRDQYLWLQVAEFSYDSYMIQLHRAGLL